MKPSEKKALASLLMEPGAYFDRIMQLLKAGVIQPHEVRDFAGLDRDE